MLCVERIRHYFVQNDIKRNQVPLLSIGVFSVAISNSFATSNSFAETSLSHL